MNGMFVEKKVQEKDSGKLDDLKISAKDCICVKGVETTASSKILAGYKPLFHATAVQRVLDEGATIIGKTVQDEFGFGSFCTSVENGVIPKNPHDEERVCGGSSGGAAAVAETLGKGHVALAESTGGSIACPAAFCGVVGVTPTYGRVSRYGLLDYASSMDKIGCIASTVEECARVLAIIAGKDEQDSTSLPDAVPDYAKALSKGVEGLTLGVLQVKGVDKTVQAAFDSACEDLKEQGAKVKPVSLPLTEKYGLAAYYILALSEASTNLAKYCGMRYGAAEKMEGNYNDYFTKVRSKYFGQEAKRRILLGTFARMSGYRDAYYLKAAKVRTLIIKEYKKVFKECDVILSPTMPVVAPTFAEAKKMKPLQMYLMDVLTVGPNLAGFPHTSVPIGRGLPKGCMIIANHVEEEVMLCVAKALHE